MCVHHVDSRATWEQISIPVAAPDQRSITKYLTPADDDALLPTLFMDANSYTLHYDLLVEAFDDLYPGLTHEEYLAMILTPSARDLYAGSITEYIVNDDGLFGFTVLDDPADSVTTVTYHQVLEVYRELDAHFDLEVLAFVPATNNQREAAADWDAEFPIHAM